jgi:hypothetical protein
MHARHVADRARLHPLALDHRPAVLVIRRFRMTKAIYYPPANRTAQWFGDDYAGALIEPNKGLWHTTETGGWPAYGGGASAPQLTYDPRKRQWRQHFPLNRSGRALRNDGIHRTNREHVVQVEIVCSSDRAFANKHGYPHVTELSSAALDDLAEFEAFMHREWGVPLVNAPEWLPYPQSYGNTRVRMTWSEFVRFHGWCGHEHAPGNSHGDPGALPVETILSRAKRLVAPPDLEPEPTPRKVNPDMVVTKFGSTRYRAICGDRIVAISEADYERCKAAGIPAPAFDNATIESFERVLVAES